MLHLETKAARAHGATFVDGRGWRLICGGAKRGVAGASRNRARQRGEERREEEAKQTPDTRRELARIAARLIIFATRNVIYSYLFASSDI